MQCKDMYKIKMAPAGACPKSCQKRVDCSGATLAGGFCFSLLLDARFFIALAALDL